VITVFVSEGPDGRLVSASASGHAGKGKRGEDLVCAAVTILLRTTLDALTANGGKGSGLAVVAETSGRGSLAFRVTDFGEKDIFFLRYAAVFLREGLSSLCREYPDAVEMRVVVG